MLLARQDVHERYLPYFFYTLVPDDLPRFSSLALDCDNKDGDDGPHKYQSPYRKTHPPV